jgi:diacylglycerol O-acyltransferase / wax synthase
MQQLRGLDALFTYGEASGWPFHGGPLSLFDPSTSPEGFDVDRVRELFRQRLALVAAFRHRLVRLPGGLAPPVWVEDREVDVADHIHGVRLPAPGTPRQLGELVGDIYMRPFDHDRPLWDKWLIEGLDSGLVAVLDRVSHSAMDGARFVEMFDATYDTDPAAPLARPGTPPITLERAPGIVERLGLTARHLAVQPLHVARTAAHIAQAGRCLVDADKRGELDGLRLPWAAPRAAFNGDLTNRRAFAFCTLPLPAITEIAHREHVTVNDVALALTGSVLRTYLQQRGELPEASLLTTFPSALAGTHESAKTVGGSEFAIAIATLGTDIADPLERLHKVAESTRAGKALLRAMRPELEMELIDLIPPALVGGVAAAHGKLGLTIRRRSKTFANLDTSGMRLGGPLYMAGARLVASYGVGPNACAAPVFVVVGYMDSLDFGFTVCPDLIPDPWWFAEAYPKALAELGPSTPI